MGENRHFEASFSPLLFRISGRDSSVGRALDWRSKGPRFDPGSRHFYINCFLMIRHTYVQKAWSRAKVLCTKAPARFELAISCLLDRRFNQLSHGAVLLLHSLNVLLVQGGQGKNDMWTKKSFAPNVGLEPTTLRLRVSCSTDWASRACCLDVEVSPNYSQNTCAAEIGLAGRTGIQQAVVAEWLRRLTRNQIPSGSVGSNPTDCEIIFPFFLWTFSMHCIAYNSVESLNYTLKGRWNV